MHCNPSPLLHWVSENIETADSLLATPKVGSVNELSLLTLIVIIIKIENDREN